MLTLTANPKWQHAPSAMPVERETRLRQTLLTRSAVLVDGPLLEGGRRLDTPWLREKLLAALLPTHAEAFHATRPAIVPDRAALLKLLTAADQTPMPRCGHLAEIILTEIAPRRAHVYWHLPELDLFHARQSLGDEAHDAALTLRFYDITGIAFDGYNAHHQFDLDVEYDEERRYVDFWSPDRQYMVELGLRARSDRFAPIARSNTIHQPRDSEAEEIANRLNVHALAGPIARPVMPELYRVHTPAIIVKPGDADWPLRDLAAEQRIRALYRELLRDGPRALRLAPPVPRTPAPERNAAYEARQAQATIAPETAGAPQKSNTRTATRKAKLMTLRLDTSATARPTARKRTLPKLPELPKAGARNRLNQADAGTARAREISLLSTLTSRGIITPEAPRALPAPAAAPEARTQPDAKTEPQPAMPKSFKLNEFGRFIDALAENGVDLEAELVLRGRVKAGKKVRIGGKVIHTAPDGSFCVRCRVVDGKLHVPVEVVQAERVIASRAIEVDMGTARRVNG